MTSLDAPADDIEALASWAVSEGGYRAPEVVFLKNSVSGTSARSKVAIPQSSPLLACPISLVIDYDKAASFLFGNSRACPFSKSPTIAIRLFLVSQKLLKSESKWAPYIKSLPESFDTPLYYSQKELQLLQGTNLIGDVELRKQIWLKEWELAIGELPKRFNRDEFTPDLYLWACTVLTSRSFPSNIIFNTANKESYPVLVPLVDSLNHYPSTPIIWTSAEGKFTLSTGANVDKGQELFNNYGPKGNEELLMGYGFCLKDNPFDSVALKIKLPPLSENKKALINTELENSAFRISPGDLLPDNLVRLFRVYVVNNFELSKLLVNGIGVPASIRSELDLSQKLFSALSIKLRGHKYLTIPNPTKREQDVILYVSHQIEILQASTTAITQRIFLTLNPKSSTDKLDDIAQLRKAINDNIRLFGFNLRNILTEAIFEEFASVIEQAFGSKDPIDILDNSLDDQVMVLFICYQYFKPESPWKAWLEAMQTRYNNDLELDSDFLEDFEGLHESLVPGLIELEPSIFNEQWTPRQLAWAARVVDSEGVVVEATDGTPVYWIIAEI
ncbi:hypothetical protein V1514DRAFT_325747 [Lipomyces japonicus]|uniref:uncharacterized protein n=1 Tax=Lipomyces japonicus TaxID=56871 RepID=UPI0034CF87C5